MINLQKGDIIFEDSEKTGAKIVKYFMRSPSLWHDLYRIITKKVKKCEYYHPLMILNGNTNEYIEQQFRVQKGQESALLAPERHILVARKVGLSRSDKNRLQAIAEGNIGALWGILESVGKFLTFLTSIPYFARYLRWPNHHVSAVRVCQWLYETYGETFGMKTYGENTTKTMVDFIRSHPKQWQIIYES